ncbi:MAG: CCA tRNA nucleotidyltransferase [Leptolyngbyaceae bacterium]|nr:CCA tRNA nucleotidyltransferase [Leptolyngbyaceae bacterium]
MCADSLWTASSVLSPVYWPFSLQWLPQPAYLVGGSVRDALLGRKTAHLDLDFVMPTHAVETAQAIARHYKAGFVLLDAERQIARVVFDQATADFAQQVGPSLESDLERRDFTVNAIAYDPHTGHLIDPLQGYADLHQHWLRMVAPENLQEDPLRLLRAYRQASQLGFSIAPETQIWIRQLSPLLSQIAAERIQSELSYLLSTPKGTPWLIAAWKDGLLQHWFPGATEQQVALIPAIDQAALDLSALHPPFEVELSRWIRDRKSSKGKSSKSPQAVGCCSSLDPDKIKMAGGRRTWLSTAKLIGLLTPVPEVAEAELLQLKYSRAEIQTVVTVLKLLPRLIAAQSSMLTSMPTSMPMSRRDQYFLFQGVGFAFPALVLLAIASGVSQEAISPLIERFLNPDDPVAHPTPLLTGQDLMQQLGLPPSPRIGQLLAALQLAHAEGQIATPTEALEWAEVLCSSKQ